MQVEYTQLLSRHTHQASAGILIIDGLVILMDCGLTDTLDLSLYAPHMHTIAQVDLVLLTKSLFGNCGGLPFLYRHMLKKPRIYSTIPVGRMCANNVYEVVASRSHQETNHALDGLSLFTAISQTFDNMVEMKQFQKETIEIQGRSLQLTPVRSGHTLGGCAWTVIYQGSATASVLFMDQVNIQNDHFLEGLDIAYLRKTRWTLMILGGMDTAIKFSNLSQQVTQLESTVLDTLQAGGNIILSSSCTDRLLELLLALHVIFKRNPQQLGQLRIAFYHPLRNFLVIYKSLIEFMLNRLSEQLHQGLSNPFDQLEYLQTAGENSKEHRVMVVGSQNLFYYGPMVSYYNRFISHANNRLVMVGPLPSLCYTCHSSIATTLSSLQAYQQQQTALQEAARIQEAQQIQPVLEMTTEVPTLLDDKTCDGPLDLLFKRGEFIQYRNKKVQFQSSPYGRITVNQTIRDYQDQVENDNHFGEILIDPNQIVIKNYSQFGPLKTCAPVVPVSTPSPHQYLPLDGLSDVYSLMNMLHVLSPQHLILTNHRVDTLDLSRFQPILMADSPISLFIENDRLNVKNFSFPDSIVVQGSQCVQVQGQLTVHPEGVQLEIRQRVDPIRQSHDDLKLHQIYGLLKKHGIVCSYQKGMIALEQDLTIKKEGGRLSFQGAYNELYVQVRRLIYTLL